MNKRQILSYIICSFTFIILSVTACKEELPCDCVEENKLQCFEGICLCKEGYGGERCEKRFCGVHGNYDAVNDTCVCEGGWYGEVCENQDLCYEVNCLGNQVCNEFTGECECSDSQSFGETCESFYRTYGGVENDERLWGITANEDGSLTLLKIKILSGAYELSLVKVDENGEEIWEQYLPSGTGTGTFNLLHLDNKVLKATSDGGYIVMFSHLTTANSKHIVLIKTDSDGNEIWDQVYDNYSFMTGRDVIETPTGYALTGYISEGVELYMYLADIHSDGSVNWEDDYGGVGQGFVGESITNVTGGGYMVLTSNEYEDGVSFQGSDVELLFINNTNGNVIWSNRIEEFNINVGKKIISDESGYLIGGTTNSAGSGFLDMYLLKTDLDGNKIWSNTYGTIKDDLALNLKKTIDGGYLLAGYQETASADLDDSKFYLVKTDFNGAKIWDKTYGGNGRSQSTDVVMLGDTSVVGVGYTTTYSGLSEDGYLIKIQNADAAID